MESDPGKTPAAVRPGGQRVAVAALVVVAFLALGLAYHDGLVWTNDLASATEPGPYRFRGVIESVDAQDGTFSLQSGEESRVFRWNITTPEVGRHYVVAAAVLDDGSLEALALSPVFVFR